MIRASIQTSANPHRIIVDKSGNGDFRTIGEAIQAATVTGTVIIVRPGVYRECVIVDRGVEIVGDGAPTRMVIEALGNNAVTFNTESASLSNVTVKAARSDAAHSAIVVLRGRPDIQGCVLSSDAGMVVLVTGSESAPALRGCTIRDGNAAGIVVEQSSLAIIEKCLVTANRRWGMIVMTGGNPVVRDCEIWNNLSGGILVRDHGTGTIERCQIHGNTNAGLEIASGGRSVRPRLRYPGR